MYSANMLRSRDTQMLPYPHFQPQTPDLTPSTSISWDPCHHLEDSPTSSPVWTASKSHSPHWHHCRDCCSSFPQWVDFSLWCALNHHHRSWTSVRITTLDQPHDTSRCTALTNYRLPPSSQGHGLTLSPPAQNRSYLINPLNPVDVYTRHKY